MSRTAREMDDRTLRAIGLHQGEPIRFRLVGHKRWRVGRISRVEADGSITFHDDDGAARSQRPDMVQVRRPLGSRGRLVWTPVNEVAVTWEQLELFSPAEFSSE